MRGARAMLELTSDTIRARWQEREGLAPAE